MLELRRRLDRVNQPALPDLEGERRRPEMAPVVARRWLAEQAGGRLPATPCLTRAGLGSHYSPACIESIPAACDGKKREDENCPTPLTFNRNEIAAWTKLFCFFLSQ